MHSPPALANPSHTAIIKIKEQLDQRHLRGHLPSESLELVSKLLQTIERLEQQIDQKKGDSTLEQTRLGQEEAMTSQLRSLTSENNQLRNHLLSLMDQLELQKIKTQDFCEQTQAKRNTTNLQLLLHNYQEREEQLKEELEEVVYKYNELMDLIHEDSQQDRQYIKRLLKHKKITVKNQRANLVIDLPIIQSTNSKETSSRVSYLEAQLLSRNAEIQRLQSMMVGI